MLAAASVSVPVLISALRMTPEILTILMTGEDPATLERLKGTETTILALTGASHYWVGPANADEDVRSAMLSMNSAIIKNTKNLEKGRQAFYISG